MKASQVSSQESVDNGRRTKAQKGAVKVENDKGWLRLKKPEKYNPEALVFMAPRGGVLDDHNFRNRPWKTVLTRLGIDYRKPYNRLS